MGTRLYVGNLPFSATDQVLSATFALCGTVSSCRIVLDRKTGRGRGFGFVEMSTSAEAADAIARLDGAGYNSCKMTVNEARPIDLGRMIRRHLIKRISIDRIRKEMDSYRSTCWFQFRRAFG